MKRISIFLCLLMSVAMLMAQSAQILQQKADKGDTQAMVQLADCYYYGNNGVEQNLRKAFELYKKASELGNTDANLDVAMYYIKGILGEKDTALAYRLVKESAEAGSPYGTYGLGLCYSYGYGVEVDKAKSFELYDKAVEMGCPLALSWCGLWRALGTYYPQDKAKGLSMMKKATKADRCQGLAWRNLAVFYFENSDNKNYEMCLKKSLDYNEYSTKIIALADEYDALQDMNGEKAIYQKAMALYHDTLGHYSSFKVLAHLMLNAKDPEVHQPDTLIALMQRSIAKGYAASYGWLGKTYMTLSDNYAEVSRERDSLQALAFDCFVRWAQSGDEDAYTCLGQCYMSGAGVDRNEEKAKECFMKGVSVWDDKCAIDLAQFYYQKENYSEAEKYARKAIEWGNKEGYNALLWSYYRNERHSAEEKLSLAEYAIKDGYPEGYAFVALNQKDTKKIIQTLEKGVANGCSMCWDDLISNLEVVSDYKRIYQLYEKRGTSKDYLNMALMLMDEMVGKGLPAENQHILELLNKSADMNDLSALMLLGDIFCTREYSLAIDDPQVGMGYYNKANSLRAGYASGDIGNYYANIGDFDKAVANFKAGADAGYSFSNTNLGKCYLMGKGVEADTAKAMECFMEAASQGYGEAQYLLGYSYLNGLYFPVDTIKAMEYLYKAALQKVAPACAIVGEAYEYGKYGFQNEPDSAIQFYYWGSENDDPICDYKIGSVLAYRGNIDGAVSYYMSAAKNGNLDAALQVGKAYLNGQGVEADPKQGFQIIRNLAEENDHAEAYSVMGICYLSGFAVENDHDKAKQSFEKAAELGSAAGNYFLAICYQSGIGCDADSLTGDAYLQKAIDMDYAPATYHRGTLLSEQGKEKEAFEYYQKAAEQGNENAMLQVGLCYQQGAGVPLNSKKAYEHFLQMSENGYASGTFMVANCYIEGIYVDQDMRKAEEWLLKAAEDGHTMACYYLGVLYEKGETDETGKQVIAPNRQKAINYYTIAAMRGNEDAAAALEQMNQKKKKK